MASGKIKTKINEIKKNILVLSLAVRHPQMPWYAKLFTFLVISYALSPIDLIPDFIPILGYLDDVILIPIGVFLALKLIPEDVINECRANINEMSSSRKQGIYGAIAIILIWIIILYYIFSAVIN
jgi:uncharacterized membrane protein YkvA (DUF1232 family)